MGWAGEGLWSDLNSSLHISWIPCHRKALQREVGGHAGKGLIVSVRHVTAGLNLTHCVHAILCPG